MGTTELSIRVINDEPPRLASSLAKIHEGMAELLRFIDGLDASQQSDLHPLVIGAGLRPSGDSPTQQPEAQEKAVEDPTALQSEAVQVQGSEQEF